MSKKQIPSIDAPSAILAALALAAIGAIFYNILPMYIGAAQDSRGWSMSEASLMGAFFFVGYTAVTASAFFWARNVNWKLACLIAVPIAALSIITTGYFESYPLNALLVIISGGASSAIYVLGTIAVGDTANPPRWMGAKIGGETALGGVFLLFAPSLLIAPYGLKGFVFGIAGVTLLCLPFLLFFPREGTKGTDSADDQSIVISKAESVGMWLLLAAIVIFFTGQTAVWSFLERLGNSSGYDPQTVGGILAVSLAAAMFGALSEAAIGDRFGFRKLVLFSIILFVLGTTVLYLEKTVGLYATGTMIVTYSVGFGVSVLMASVAVMDRGGRYIILSVPTLGLGAIFGPGIAGFIMENFGGAGLLVLAIISAVLCYALFCQGMIRGRREAALHATTQNS